MDTPIATICDIRYLVDFSFSFKVNAITGYNFGITEDQLD